MAVDGSTNNISALNKTNLANTSGESKTVNTADAKRPPRKMMGLFRKSSFDSSPVCKSPRKFTLTPRSKPGKGLADLVGDSAINLLDFQCMNEPGDSPKQSESIPNANSSAIPVSPKRDSTRGETSNPSHAALSPRDRLCLTQGSKPRKGISDLMGDPASRLLSFPCMNDVEDNANAATLPATGASTRPQLPLRKSDSPATGSRNVMPPRPTKSMPCTPRPMSTPTPSVKTLTWTRPEIEVFDGLVLPLCGAEETLDAILSEKAKHLDCSACGIFLYYVDEATMVICPICREVSRTESSSASSLTPKAGLGITIEQLSQLSE